MDKFDYRYAEGKWNIKEIIQHVIDTERIFGYRALRFPETIKPHCWFDENYYVNNTEATARSIQDLLAEFSAVRHSNLFLLKVFQKIN
jgi:hypothetical protein